jgi:hypothetical protein
MHASQLHDDCIDRGRECTAKQLTDLLPLFEGKVSWMAGEMRCGPHLKPVLIQYLFTASCKHIHAHT